MYGNLPNKGAGRSSKIISNNLGTKLTFLSFQHWIRIENRTNIKETMVILVISGTVVFLQTWGVPLLWGAPLISRLRLSLCYGRGLVRGDGEGRVGVIEPECYTEKCYPGLQEEKYVDVRDRSLFMAGGGSGSNEFLQEIFLRPTHRTVVNFRRPLLGKISLCVIA